MDYKPLALKERKPNLQEAPKETHSGHTITVQFNQTKGKHTVHWTHPQTVLDAVKSLSAYHENIKCPDDQVVLQLGQADRETTIPTHFPCCLLNSNYLIVFSSKEKVEDREEQEVPVLPSDQYIFFYVETKGGRNAKTLAQKKQGLFRSSASREFSKLCVYAPKGTTVREALQQDGRFIVPDSFTLSDVKGSNLLTEDSQPVDSLHRRTYRICVPLTRGSTRNAPAKASPSVKAPGGQTAPKAHMQTEQTGDHQSSMGFLKRKRSSDTKAGASTAAVETCVVLPKTKAVRVLLLLQSPNHDEVLQLLRQQFPNLRKWMEDRFPDDSFKAALKKVNFGKVQQEFREVFRLKKLISLGDSVCFLNIGDICQGSGFVLFGNFILTNAHLLEKALSQDGRDLIVPVRAVFNYEENPRSDEILIFETLSEVIDLDRTMDYAVLRLKNQENQAVPLGLLPYFGPKPDDGGAGIIGHPGGEVKKIDLTFIIGKNERQSAANQQLEPYDDSTRMVIVQNVVEEGIDNIWCADPVITYNTTNMFHGSSGSPLIDDECRVVGLHSAGFHYEYEGQKHSVIAYAHSVLEIFSRFVFNTRARGRMDLLKEIAQNSGDNPHLRRIFQSYDLV